MSNDPKWTAGDRVQWRCSDHNCDREIHVGRITGLTIEKAREMGLRVIQRQMRAHPAVGILFDDQPDWTITFAPLPYVFAEGAPILERVF